MIATGCSLANSASGAYHWRIWYMLTVASAKYTAIWMLPAAGRGSSGPRRASSRRADLECISLRTTRLAVLKSLRKLTTRLNQPFL